MKQPRGFTLIELVVVIVILGILAATVLPKFIDFRTDAEKAVVENFVGAIGTARMLWVAKAAVCGSDYATKAFSIYSVLHLDTNPSSRTPTCRDFTDIKNNTGLTDGCCAATLDVHPIKVSLAADPSVDLVLTGGSPSVSDKIALVTKTGRTVTISVDQTSGATSWTASPSY